MMTTTKTTTDGAAYMCAARDRHGLTWQATADICGVTVGAAQKWGAGTQPSARAVLAMQQWVDNQGDNK